MYSTFSSFKKWYIPFLVEYTPQTKPKEIRPQLDEMNIQDMELNNLMVRLQPWDFENADYPFIVIAPGFILYQNDITWSGPIHWSNRISCVQRNDCC